MWNHLANILENDGEKLKKFQELWAYYKNIKINVTSITNEDEFILKNFYDSLFPFIQKKQEGSLIDIGTGGGFPAIPLAIMFPEIEITAVDSQQKKIEVVKKAAGVANVKNIRAIAARIEEIGASEKHREQYDIVTTRALAKWGSLLEYAIPLAKVGGHVIAYQGPAIKEELKNTDTLTLLGGEIEDVLEYALPEKYGKRIAVIIKKVAQTPEKFPRNAKKMKTRPL